jgi:hypothetical protein
MFSGDAMHRIIHEIISVHILMFIYSIPLNISYEKVIQGHYVE